MKSVNKMTQPELGAFVQSHLRTKGIEVVLSGGAAVALYTEGKYVSEDLDMIPPYGVRRRALVDAMREIGFEETGSRHFVHPSSDHFVEFPPGPLSIGEERIRRFDEIKYSTGILKVISPTDCVKDRLAAYYHWGDRQGLAQAIMVAKERQIDLSEVLRWSKVEGMEDRFEDFNSGLVDE